MFFFETKLNILKNLTENVKRYQNRNNAKQTCTTGLKSNAVFTSSLNQCIYVGDTDIHMNITKFCKMTNCGNAFPLSLLLHTQNIFSLHILHF